jgi:hypothetical protein
MDSDSMSYWMGFQVALGLTRHLKVGFLLFQGMVACSVTLLQPYREMVSLDVGPYLKDASAASFGVLDGTSSLAIERHLRHQSYLMYTLH